jgi:hypothetical protein
MRDLEAQFFQPARQSQRDIGFAAAAAQPPMTARTNSSSSALGGTVRQLA